jgi:hypothetical protein
MLVIPAMGGDLRCETEDPVMVAWVILTCFEPGCQTDNTMKDISFKDGLFRFGSWKIYTIILIILTG